MARGKKRAPTDQEPAFDGTEAAMTVDTGVSPRSLLVYVYAFDALHPAFCARKSSQHCR